MLYALIYAAAGSLVSRAEDLQMLALPLSLIAIVGYLQAVLALTGGIAGFIRFASYFPFWSPFVMLTRLAVGRVEPWEIVLSFGLLLADRDRGRDRRPGLRRGRPAVRPAARRSGDRRRGVAKPVGRRRTLSPWSRGPNTRCPLVLVVLDGPDGPEMPGCSRVTRRPALCWRRLAIL